MESVISAAVNSPICHLMKSQPNIPAMKIKLCLSVVQFISLCFELLFFPLQLSDTLRVCGLDPGHNMVKEISEAIFSLEDPTMQYVL